MHCHMYSVSPRINETEGGGGGGKRGEYLLDVLFTCYLL